MSQPRFKLLLRVIILNEPWLLGLTTERLKPTEDATLPERFSIGLVIHMLSHIILTDTAG
jgi:hypothetical protein